MTLQKTRFLNYIFLEPSQDKIIDFATKGIPNGFEMTDKYVNRQTNRLIFRYKMKHFLTLC